MSQFTDTNKLTNRIDTHKNFSKLDINDWILRTVDLKNGNELLDIGCGTGEQIIRFGKQNDKSNLIGIDISKKSLDVLKKRCIEEKIKNINTIECDIDKFENYLQSDKLFDVIISCFALYYSKDIKEIIKKIKNKLKPDGRIFICGPIPGNNSELIDFQSKISPDVISKTKYVMIEEILPEILKNFKNIEKKEFVNPINFPDHVSLINYWKSYYLYDSNIEERFVNNIHKYFETNKKFTATKKVLGILAGNKY